MIRDSGNPTYRLPCDGPMTAYRSIYRRFLLDSELTMPECAVYGRAKMLAVYEHGGIPSEREFVRRLCDPEVDTVTCTASTDKADTRRVVLLLKCGAPSERECLLTFPCAKHGLTKEETALLELLLRPPEG